MVSICKLFLTFIIYSFLGWIVEIIFCFIKNKKFTDRGFLIGPLCPIYGVSSIIMILYLRQYTDNFITVFFLAIIIAGVMEYLTSYLMEKLFHARWWDYSDKSFNINGRVCLKYLVYFGFLGLLLMYIITPLVVRFIQIFNNNTIIILTIILLILFLIDLIASLNIGYKIKKQIILVQHKTEEFAKLFFDDTKSKKFLLQNRLLKSFPKIKPIKFKK